MGAGGDLGHHAAPLGMQRVLALHHRGEDLARRRPRPGAHHGDGGVVAAALDPEDDASAWHASLPRCAGCGPQVTPARRPRNRRRFPETRTEPPWPPPGRSSSPGRGRSRRPSPRCWRRELPGRFRPVVSPVLEIVPLPAPLDLDGLQGLIFTSANGVEQFAARSPDRSLPAWCVGEMTAAAARRAGFAARSADGDVGDLAALVVAGHRPGAGDFLHLRGAHAAGDLTGRLAAAGVPARAAAIYDQRPRPLTAEALALLAAGGMDVLTFFSPRTARLVAAAGRGAGWNLSRTVAVALSPAADAAFAGPEPALRRIAAAPTRDGMLAALAALP